MTERFVYDTYALVELLNKNPNYKKYLDNDMIINDFIFSEFTYQLVKADVKNMDDYLNEIEPAITRLSTRVIKQAMKFRYTNKKKKMSMTDCISYFQAKELGIKFLTGDKEFQDQDNVEFVK
jgi:predicted nucleic acid-binding protein